MQYPMRDVITLDNPAYATVLGERSASLFVPGSWTGRRILLRPAAGVNWSSVEGETGKAVWESEGWDLSAAMEPGRWQRVTVRGGVIQGAVLEGSDPLYISRLEAWYEPPESLSIRLRLGRSPESLGREGLINLGFTLTDEGGQQVGRLEVVVGPKTAELTVAMAITQEPVGRCRLKGAVCIDQQVVDVARVDVLEFD